MSLEVCFIKNISSGKVHFSEQGLTIYKDEVITIRNDNPLFESKDFYIALEKGWVRYLTKIEVARFVADKL